MVRNLLSQCPERMEHRPKVLLLGMSYPDVQAHMEEHEFSQDILVHKESSVEQAVECVRRGILTEMDGRDLARCLATEKVCNVNVYTASKEVGAIYRSDRHVYGDFNSRNFCSNIKKAFASNTDGDIQFSQVVLDYYWMPTGWLVTRWAKTLFQRTLPDLVRHNLLTYPSTRNTPSNSKDGAASSSSRRRRQTSSHEEGVVLLPFCAHVCKELVGAIDILEQYFAITFVKKCELEGHALWRGTMSIDADTMQSFLGKRLDQEEVYCTFRPKDIYESMEDSHVSKPEVMRVLMAIEDYDNIRMIRLRPLRQHEPPSVMRERLIKPEIGGFKGLNFRLAIIAEQKKKLALKQQQQETEQETQQEETQQEEEKPQGQQQQEQKEQQPSSSSKKSAPKAKKKRNKKRTQKKNIRSDDSSSDESQTLTSATTQSKRPTETSSKKKALPSVSRVLEDDDDASMTQFDDDDSESSSSSTEEDEIALLPDITYFFPTPVIDLETYMDPDECAKQDQTDYHSSGSMIGDHPARNPSTIRTPTATTSTAVASTARSTKRSMESAMKLGFQDLDNVQNNGPEYLSFNPRCHPVHKRKVCYERGKQTYTYGVSASSVLDLEDYGHNKNIDGIDIAAKITSAVARHNNETHCRDRTYDGACALFDLRHAASLKACYKIPKHVICDAIKNEETPQTQVEAHQDYDMIRDMTIFQSAVQACRGEWESVLDDTTLLEIEKHKTYLRKLMRKSKARKDGAVGSNSYVVIDSIVTPLDRTVLLDTILRWLVFEREPSLDPTGELASIYDHFSCQRKSFQSTGLVNRAKLIEREWTVRSRKKKKKNEAARAAAPCDGGETSAEAENDNDVNSTPQTTTVTAEAGLEEANPILCTKALEYLKLSSSSLPLPPPSPPPLSPQKTIEQAASPPSMAAETNLFQKIDFLLPKSKDQSLDDRARELASGFEIMHNLSCIDSVEIPSPPSPSLSPLPPLASIAADPQAEDVVELGESYDYDDNESVKAGAACTVNELALVAESILTSEVEQEGKLDRIENIEQDPTPETKTNDGSKEAEDREIEKYDAEPVVLPKTTDDNEQRVTDYSSLDEASKASRIFGEDSLVQIPSPTAGVPGNSTAKAIRGGKVPLKKRKRVSPPFGMKNGEDYIPAKSPKLPKSAVMNGGILGNLHVLTTALDKRPKHGSSCLETIGTPKAEKKALPICKLQELEKTKGNDPPDSRSRIHAKSPARKKKEVPPIPGKIYEKVIPEKKEAAKKPRLVNEGENSFKNKRNYRPSFSPQIMPKNHSSPSQPIAPRLLRSPMPPSPHSTATVTPRRQTFPSSLEGTNWRHSPASVSQSPGWQTESYRDYLTAYTSFYGGERTLQLDNIVRAMAQPSLDASYIPAFARLIKFFERDTAPLDDLAVKIEMTDFILQKHVQADWGTSISDMHLHESLRRLSHLIQYALSEYYERKNNFSTSNALVAMAAAAACVSPVPQRHGHDGWGAADQLQYIINRRPPPISTAYVRNRVHRPDFSAGFR